jgi:hypothetical protein
MKVLPESLDQIAARIEDLERRVVALEHARPDAAGEPVPLLRAPAPVATWPEPQAEFTSVFPVLGSALLGIAGAYLLRAVSGADLLPRTAVALIAAVYAGAWLVAASRRPLRSKLAGALFVAVSILILAPMLWEMTIRFNAMRGTAAAAILALYVAAAAVLALWRGGAVVFSVAIAGSAIAAAALSIATHRMAEFTYLLLAMLVLCEWAGRKLDTRGVRVLVALAADVGVWTLLLIYRLAPGDRTDYPAVSAALVLCAAFLLFAMEAAAIVRTVLARGEPVPVLSAIQAMLAFALMAVAILWLVPAYALPALGSLCAVLAAGCYAAAYGPIRRAGQRRNFRILSVWAAALLLGATFTLAPAATGSIALGIAALAAFLLARWRASKTLELQGVVFLLVAAAASGLAEWTAGALAGPAPANPGAPVLAVAACAVLACASAAERAGEEWRKQALHLVPALVAAFAGAALFAIALLDVFRGFATPEAFHVALIRTVALCSLALALAFAGGRLGRTALVRTAYAAVALVTAKLLFEDLRHGRLEYTAGSIVAVALTLIAVPRLTRTRRNVSTEQKPAMHP